MYLTHLYIVHFWEIHICITNKVLGVMNRIKTKYFEKKKWWYFFESISYFLYISLSSSPVRSLNILRSIIMHSKIRIIGQQACFFHDIFRTFFVLILNSNCVIKTFVNIHLSKTFLINEKYLVDCYRHPNM